MGKGYSRRKIRIQVKRGGEWKGRVEEGMWQGIKNAVVVFFYYINCVSVCFNGEWGGCIHILQCSLHGGQRKT